jgi:phage protein U
MLFQLGAVTMRVYPMNVDRVSEQSGVKYVEKPVLGRAPPLEYVADEAGTIQFSGTLFPKKFGGERELALLQAMRMSRLPQILVRGDGLPIGWVVIRSVNVTSTSLAGDGIGRVVGVRITCVRDEPPLVSALFTLIGGLLS